MIGPCAARAVHGELFRHHCAHHGAACDTDSNPADSIVIPPRVIDRDLQAKSPNAIWHFGKLP